MQPFFCMNRVLANLCLLHLSVLNQVQCLVATDVDKGNNACLITNIVYTHTSHTWSKHVFLWFPTVSAVDVSLSVCVCE